NGADLRHRIERLELGMGIGRDISHAVGLRNSEVLQDPRPPIATIKKLFVTQAQLSIDYGFTVSVKLARTPRKFNRRQRSFHKDRDEAFLRRSGETLSTANRGAQAGSDQRHDFSGYLNRGFDVTGVCEMAGDIDAGNICFERLRVINGN